MLPLRGSSLASRRGQVQKSSFLPPLQLVISIAALVFVAANNFFLHHVVWSPSKSPSASSSSASSKPLVVSNPQPNRRNGPAAGPLSSCDFREYPPHRYYELQRSVESDKKRDFLTSKALYIYGEWPILLPIDDQPLQQAKLCVHQEEWRTTTTTNANVLPFADGTNPSLLSMARFQKEAMARSTHTDFVDQLQQHTVHNNIKWLATAGMTNSQCRWNDSAADSKKYRVNIDQDKPDTVRTMLLLLNDQFETISQATLHLIRDAPWGKRGQVKALSVEEQADPKKNNRVFAFGDADLFLHDGQLWISYRECKLYDCETQVLNPVHLEWNGGDSNDSNNMLSSFTATIRASESATLCCGRNMALMEPQASQAPVSSSQPVSLQALTWVDPITVVDVDTTPLIQLRQQQKQKRLLLQEEETETELQQSRTRAHEEGPLPSPSLEALQVQLPPQQHRRLAARKDKKKKSDIHGTNAFMVYWPDEQVYLGMGHHHRPNDREPNEYARFGHHYAHMLFAVRRRQAQTAGTSSNGDYYLHSLSPEFVIPSFHHANDAEVIQFASGLEIDEQHNKLVIGYGINDCEAAVVTMDLTRVKSLLRPVPDGKQVVDLMQPLKE